MQSMPGDLTNPPAATPVAAPVQVEGDGGVCPRGHDRPFQLRQRLPQLFFLQGFKLLGCGPAHLGRLHRRTHIRTHLSCDLYKDTGW